MSHHAQCQMIQQEPTATDQAVKSLVLDEPGGEPGVDAQEETLHDTSAQSRSRDRGLSELEAPDGAEPALGPAHLTRVGDVD